jgi:RsiW-degrading membrane proteinase PrsW (M82 family)
MIDSMVNCFVSFFQNPSAWGIGLAIGFGAVWLACYRPPLFKKPWLWAVLAGGAFLTPAAACFIAIPLQMWTVQALDHFRSQEVLLRWILPAAITLIGGLVGEGAKMVPVVVYWRRSGKNIDPKLGLAIGAVAGAGFGILIARLSLNAIFFIPWVPWETIQAGGFVALPVFWESFFRVATNIAFSALAGYGLARGRGWQFYLIASGLSALLGYGTLLLVKLLPNYAEIYTAIYTAVVAVAVTACALWLRWRKRTATADTTTSSP